MSFISMSRNYGKSARHPTVTESYITPFCNIIEPIFEPTFIFDSYACRKGKGTHKAVDRFTEFSRKNAYVLKCDIKKYFPSIDHEILKTQFRRKIRDAQVLWLIDLIVDNSNPQEYVHEYFEGDDLLTPLNRQRGIPIGNLTSQFFANIYLNRFDHFVKEDLRCRYYIRYMDDFVVLEKDKARLHQMKAEMAGYLAQFRLKLHAHKCQIFPVKDGTDFLGYQVFPTHRRLRPSSVRRARRRLRRLREDYEHEKISWADVNHSVQSWLGHVKHADTYGLRGQSSHRPFFGVPDTFVGTRFCRRIGLGLLGFGDRTPTVAFDVFVGARSPRPTDFRL